jgi:sugar O-acyltransferase (sialic acid O-acetyltransferase NeuD family)
MVPASLLIIGGGGHGKVVADLARALGHPVAGFIDADEGRIGQTVLGAPVLGTMNRLEHIARAQNVTTAAVAIGDNRVRLEHAVEVRRAGLTLATLVHPSATVAESATLGEGTVVCAGGRVCVEARIGRACIVNTNAVVDHECVLGEAVHICPAAALAGRVEVGDGTFVGIGASVIQCLRLGAWATVGAGAVVVRDVEANTTVVGCPAR